MGLNPTDASSKTWTVELVAIAEALDLEHDYTQLLHLEANGNSELTDNVPSNPQIRVDMLLIQFVFFRSCGLLF